MNKLDPFMECPRYETKSFILRLTEKSDTEQLFKCYSDRNAVQLMNADNCLNNFYYDTMEKMQQAVDFWVESYKNRWFIRFTIIDKAENNAVGTIEIFAGECAVYRVDLQSEYEKDEYLIELYQLAEKEFFILFNNERIVTKAITEAVSRRKALTYCGWKFIDKFREYDNYYEVLGVQ